MAVTVHEHKGIKKDSADTSSLLRGESYENVGDVTIASQMVTTNGKMGPTRGKWDSAKGKDSEVTAKPQQS